MTQVSARPARSRGSTVRRAALSAGLAVMVTAALGMTASAASAADGATRAGPVSGQLVSPLALGLNTAPWDYVYAAGVSAGGGLDTIQPLLQTAGIDLMRYGGGSYADYYDWQTNTDIQTCIWGNPFGSFTGTPFPYDTTAPFTGASCDNADSLPFDQFAAQARAIGAQTFVTVNYGSGTPAEAAAWVSHAGGSVALWEVGNENYGCWEVNNWLAQAPEHFSGYKPNDYTSVNGVTENPTCPQVTQGDAAGTQTLATSYAVNARAFLAAMKRASPRR